MSQHDAQADTESVLRAYFKELDAALSALPRAKRRQLAAEIRQLAPAARPYRLAARHGTARNGRMLRAGDLRRRR